MPRRRDGPSSQRTACRPSYATCSSSVSICSSSRHSLAASVAGLEILTRVSRSTTFASFRPRNVRYNAPGGLWAADLGGSAHADTDVLHGGPRVGGLLPSAGQR